MNPKQCNESTPHACVCNLGPAHSHTNTRADVQRPAVGTSCCGEDGACACGFRVVEVEGKLHLALLRKGAALLQWHLEEVNQRTGGLEEHVLTSLIAHGKAQMQPCMRRVLMLECLSSGHTPVDLNLCRRLSSNSVRFILGHLEEHPKLLKRPRHPALAGRVPRANMKSFEKVPCVASPHFYMPCEGCTGLFRIARSCMAKVAQSCKKHQR